MIDFTVSNASSSIWMFSIGADSSTISPDSRSDLSLAFWGATLIIFLRGWTGFGVLVWLFVFISSEVCRGRFDPVTTGAGGVSDTGWIGSTGWTGSTTLEDSLWTGWTAWTGWTCWTGTGCGSRAIGWTALTSFSFFTCMVGFTSPTFFSISVSISPYFCLYFWIISLSTFPLVIMVRILFIDLTLVSFFSASNASTFFFNSFTSLLESLPSSCINSFNSLSLCSSKTVWWSLSLVNASTLVFSWASLRVIRTTFLLSFSNETCSFLVCSLSSEPFSSRSPSNSLFTWANSVSTFLTWISLILTLFSSSAILPLISSCFVDTFWSSANFFLVCTFSSRCFFATFRTLSNLSFHSSADLSDFILSSSSFFIASVFLLFWAASLLATRSLSFWISSSFELTCESCITRIVAKSTSVCCKALLERTNFLVISSFADFMSWICLVLILSDSWSCLFWNIKDWACSADPTMPMILFSCWSLSDKFCFIFRTLASILMTWFLKDLSLVSTFAACIWIFSFSLRIVVITRYKVPSLAFSRSNVFSLVSVSMEEVWSSFPLWSNCAKVLPTFLCNMLFCSFKSELISSQVFRSFSCASFSPCSFSWNFRASSSRCMFLSKVAFLSKQTDMFSAESSWFLPTISWYSRLNCLLDSSIVDNSWVLMLSSRFWPSKTVWKSLIWILASFNSVFRFSLFRLYSSTWASVLTSVVSNDFFKIELSLARDSFSWTVSEISILSFSVSAW